MFVTQNHYIIPKTGVESLRKAKCEVSRASCGSCDTTAQCGKGNNTSSKELRKFSYYCLKRNQKKIKKEFGESFEDFSMSYVNLPLIHKLDELIQKEVTFYKRNSRQRCFKCRKYGHIAKECNKICQTCGFYHPGKICLTTLISNFQEIICVNYMSFARQYDRICQSIENLSKIGFNTMKVTPCQQLYLPPDEWIEAVEYEEKEEPIGEVNYLNAMFNTKLTSALYKIKADYAHINKVDIKAIKCISDERFDIKNGLTYEIQPQFKKNNFLQYMGSGIYATMSYKLVYDKANIVVKHSVGPYGRQDGPLYAYNRYKKEIKHNKDPVFVINEGHNLQYKYNRQLPQKLERYNKMLRLYNSKDELEIKKSELEIANKQLVEINKKIEDKTFDYLHIDDKFKLKLDKLRGKYDEIHQQLIKQTRKAKDKNIKQLNKVKYNCIQQARQAVDKKRQYIQTAERVLASSSDAGLYNKLKEVQYQLKGNIVIRQTYNKDGFNYIDYEYVNTDSGIHTLEFPDLHDHVIRQWKDTYGSEYYENVEYVRNFVQQFMNDIKKKRVCYKEKKSVVNQPIINESSEHFYDSESDSED